jgi:hypothetical protein
LAKIDLSDLSVISSVKIDSADRLRNLKLFLRFFEQFFRNYEIVLVEQDLESKAEAAIKSSNNIKHFLRQSDGCHYKTKNLNLATAISTRKFIMMCDVDVFVPPQGVAASVNLVRSGARFVAPYNGVMVEVKRNLIRSDLDFEQLLRKLKFVDRYFDLKIANYDFTDFVPIYGCSKYESLGGAILYERESFYRAGGWNENIVSYGFEDMEFFYRVEKLGSRIERISAVNCYHLEHARRLDSVYNEFYRSNEREYDKVTKMPIDELRKYAHNGFRQILLDHQLELKIENSPSEFSMRTCAITKIDLSAIAIVIALDCSAPDEWLDLDSVLDYLEKYFRSYSVLIVEIASRKFKYLNNKKNVQYIWLGQGHILDDAEQAAVSSTDRRIVDVNRCTGREDLSSFKVKYEQLLKGKTPEQLFTPIARRAKPY